MPSSNRKPRRHCPSKSIQSTASTPPSHYATSPATVFSPAVCLSSGFPCGAAIVTLFLLTQTSLHLLSPPPLSAITRRALPLSAFLYKPAEHVREPQTDSSTHPLPTAQKPYVTPFQPHLPSLAIAATTLSNMATWNSASTSGTTSSKASSLFGLDEDDKKDILVYKYRSGSKSLEVSSQHDLCKALDSGKFRGEGPDFWSLLTEGRPP